MYCSLSDLIGLVFQGPVAVTGGNRYHALLRDMSYATLFRTSRFHISFHFQLRLSIWYLSALPDIRRVQHASSFPTQSPSKYSFSFTSRYTIEHRIQLHVHPKSYYFSKIRLNQLLFARKVYLGIIPITASRAHRSASTTLEPYPILSDQHLALPHT